MTIHRAQMPGALPLQTRSAPINSVDPETRTVKLVYTTGAKVRRARWVGWDTRIPFDETIEVSDAAINAARLNAGAPALDSHSTYTTRSQVGVVERHWIENGEGWASVRFPSAGIDPNADRMFSLVQEGIVRNVSVGYSIDKVRVVPATDKEVEQRIVERWTPHEISFVTVPADVGAGVRSANGGDDAPLYPVDVVEPTQTRSLETAMDPENTPNTTETRADPVNTPAAATAANQAANEALVRAERSRVSEIMTIGTRHNLDTEFVQRHITEGTTLDAYRAAVLNHLHANEPARRVTSSVTVIDPGQSPAAVRAIMVLGLVQRATGVEAKSEAGVDPNQVRGYANMSLLDLGAELYDIRGRHRPAALYQEITQRAAMGSTDFPNLLSAAANKILLAAYQYQEATYRRIARKRNFNDFKPHNFLRIGDFPLLQGLSETGEFRNGTLSESKELLSAATYGRIVSLSRQMMINDDLNAFSDLTGAAGRRVMDFENQLAWSIILANNGTGPTMQDTGALFNGTALTSAGGHANLAATASAPTVAGLDAGRQSLRTKKSLDGVPLNITPSILLAGPKQQTAIEQVLSTQLLATQLSNINVFMDKFDPVIDAYITDYSWYLFGDPNVAPVFSWGYVDGFEGPRFTIDQPFREDGLALKVVEDFGFGAIDYRGAYRNAGAAPTLPG